MDDWLPYIDKYGFLTPTGTTTGNGIMYSIYWAMYLRENHLVEHEYNPHLDKLAQSLAACWVPNGGLNRDPSNKKQIQQADDYIGVGLLDLLLGTSYSSRLLDVARNNWGIINNVNPGKFKWKCWIFRMPHVRAHLQFAAGEKPGPLGVAAWAITLLWSLTKLHKRDSRVKAWIRIETMRRANPQGAPTVFLHLAADIWAYFFSRRYNGVGHAEYMGVLHPARIYFWNRMPSKRTPLKQSWAFLNLSPFFLLSLTLIL